MECSLKKLIFEFGPNLRLRVSVGVKSRLGINTILQQSEITRNLKHNFIY